MSERDVIEDIITRMLPSLDFNNYHVPGLTGAMQVLEIRSIINLDKAVEKLDATSSRLATMNIVLTVGIAFLGAVQLAVAMLAYLK
jgi:hypothetical protein